MAEERTKDWGLGQVPEGVVPVFFRREGMVAFLPEERIHRLIVESIRPELLRNLSVLVYREVDRQMSLLRRKGLTQHSFIGICLVTILLVTSVILSTLSFVTFNLPNIGITFVYAAIAALGGMMFILSRSKRERM